MIQLHNCLANGLVAGVLVSAALLPVAAVAATPESVVYSFRGTPDGLQPQAGLISVNGTLYGTTAGGGAYGFGTVFSVNPTTGAETAVYSFKGTPDGLQPLASLIDVKGMLYGTTEGGGFNGYGTVFKINPTTGAERVVYSFCDHSINGNCTDGSFPVSGLIDVGRTLYGTTVDGGAGSCIGGDGCGTVFSIDPTTGGETVVYSFQAGLGYPHAGLIDVKGILYGMTESNVFSVDPGTGAETVLHSFGSGADGFNPMGGLVNVGDTLYGTTGAGGAYGFGTVFSVNRTTGAEAVVYSFCRAGGICPDGVYPYAGVIDVAATLYGTTYEGGAGSCIGGDGCGTVFSIDPTTGAETVLHSFCRRAECKDGQQPEAGLIDANGTLYGTTTNGGANNFGTVFELTLP